MAETKAEEKHLGDGPQSPKKKNSVRYPFYFVEKNYMIMMMTKTMKRCRKKPEHQKCMTHPKETDGKYVPKRTDPEEDALQLHTDSEIAGENLKTHKRQSNRDSKKNE